MSYTQLLYHIVLCTYRRKPTLCQEHERDLYAYIYGMCRNRNVTVYRIGGMPDHVHLLVGLPSTLSVAKFVQSIKSVTSMWMNNNPRFPKFTYWSKEYAAFSCSQSVRDTIVNYIRNQKKHHSKQTFEEEYRKVIEENGVHIDDEFFLRD